MAERAAISSDYYTRLEQGRERNPSPQVVDALAAALNLSPVETGYLRSLVGPALATPIPTQTAVNEFPRLSQAIALALPLSLLDLPEGPHRRGQQANHHGQK